ncbi:MAG: hypothetical protein ACOZJZ_03380, partial [Pseudomonadota bacterium]
MRLGSAHERGLSMRHLMEEDRATLEEIRALRQQRSEQAPAPAPPAPPPPAAPPANPFANFPPPQIVVPVATPAAAPAVSVPTASAVELASVDLMLADPLNRELVAAFAPNPVRPGSDFARAQAARYGAERFGRMQQLAQATAAVREQYAQAVNQAQANRPTQHLACPPPGWRYETQSIGEGELSYKPVFDVDAFTRWYARQDSLAARAFASIYGGSQTTTTVHGENEHRVSTTVIGGGLFELRHGSWYDAGEGGGQQGFSPGHLSAHGEVVTIDAQGHPELHQREAVWFDPAMGFVTHAANVVQHEDWIDKAAPVVFAAFMTWLTCGGAGSLFAAGSAGASAAAASSMSTLVGSAAAGATGSAVAGTLASAATVSALHSVFSGVASGTLSFRDVLRSAATGALTAGIGSATGLGGMGLDRAGNITSYAQRALAITGQATLQGALQKLAGGDFKQGFSAAVAAGLAGEFTRGLQADIAAKVAAGQLGQAEASMFRMLAQATGSAIRTLGHPNDAGFAFAQDFINTLMQPPPAAAAAAPAPPNAQADFRAQEIAQQNETEATRIVIVAPRMTPEQRALYDAQQAAEG